ncbi:MAG TPA: MFS transporter [Acidimicrobiia bacterium]|nr:MFS transporter [Acidimicrobiia bacterium]
MTETHGPAWRAGFGSLMAVAMASATLLLTSVGIVATFIIDDLGISRAQLGILLAANSVMAALGSPLVGRIVDGMGGKRSVIVVFATSAVGFLGMAVSPVYLLMAVPMAVAALGQAATNPATNKLIAALAMPGKRALLTGVKQSGVQLGIFLAGVTLPSLAGTIGWRWAFVAVAAVPLVAIPVSALFLPGDPPVRPLGKRADRASLPPAITVLAVYGALMGFGAAYTFLVPLYVEESLGFTPIVGGLAAGLTGLTAVVGRIAWARWSERHGRFFVSLRTIAAMSVFAALAYGAAGWWGPPGLLWVGVVLTGVSSSSWNSVANLAVMAEAGIERAGRGSGVMMLGFLGGLGVGPPIYGWTVDVTGSYTTMWLVATASLACGLVVAATWAARSASTVGS